MFIHLSERGVSLICSVSVSKWWLKTRSAALSVPKMQPAGPISTTTGHLQVKSKKVLHLDHFKQTTCVDIIKYSPKSRLASGKCRLWAASLTHSLTSSQGGGWRVWELDPALSPNVWSTAVSQQRRLAKIQAELRVCCLCVTGRQQGVKTSVSTRVCRCPSRSGQRSTLSESPCHIWLKETWRRLECRI